MDFFMLNKVVGVVFMVFILMMGFGIMFDIIFKLMILGKLGYEIVVVLVEDLIFEVILELDVVLIFEFFLVVSVSDGEKVVKKCIVCYIFDNGGVNKVGLNFWDIVGWKLGGYDGFNYFLVMVVYGDVNFEWIYESFVNFLEVLKKYIFGILMGFVGLCKLEECVDMIVYMCDQFDVLKLLLGE